jgi:HEAT repeat protein
MSSLEREALLDALRSHDSARMAQALTQLAADGTTLDEELVTVLVALLGVPDKQVSRRVAGALAGCVGDERLEPLLRGALKSDLALARWGAAFAIAGADVFDELVGEAALEALAIGDGDIRWAAAQIVRAVCEHEPEFVRRVEDAARAGRGEQRKMAIYCLRDLGHRDAGVYVAALAAEDAGTRHAALSALQACGVAENATIEAVLKRLEQEADAGVRRSIAVVLGRIMGAHTGAARALAQAADDSDDPDFKKAVGLVLRAR